MIGIVIDKEASDRNVARGARGQGAAVAKGRRGKGSFSSWFDHPFLRYDPPTSRWPRGMRRHSQIPFPQVDGGLGSRPQLGTSDLGRETQPPDHPLTSRPVLLPRYWITSRLSQPALFDVIGVRESQIGAQIAA